MSGTDRAPREPRRRVVRAYRGCASHTLHAHLERHTRAQPTLLEDHERPAPPVERSAVVCGACLHFRGQWKNSRSARAPHSVP